MEENLSNEEDQNTGQNTPIYSPTLSNKGIHSFLVRNQEIFSSEQLMGHS